MIQRLNQAPAKFCVIKIGPPNLEGQEFSSYSRSTVVDLSSGSFADLRVPHRCVTFDD
ncbi:hypothetical protein BRADO2188 [Bradyrhizobium sp. ORS 278]|nr:hypothetical protein BRADO2188 [Bradyrhizobium sp. ORS 278]